ncbi:DUF4097 family beta strand repeat-containing protein [Gallicola sp. Sow4_E12]|uniref:DUF4097 family beta strand repeat-containing protein n=1 Tax=Gallicola sp. Sow4_E12 TaxID=3438785 RepID=UPI003F8E8A8B
MKQTEYLDLMDYYFRNADPLVYEEIKKDFEDHFRQGIEDGKKEEEIAHELGDPKEIFLEYKEEGIIEENARFDFSIFGTIFDEIGEKFSKKKKRNELQNYSRNIPEQVHRIEIASEGYDIKIRNHKENSISIHYISEKSGDLPIQTKGSLLKIGSLEPNHLLNPSEAPYVKKAEIWIPEGNDMGINIWSLSGNSDIDVLNNDITLRVGKGEILLRSKGRSAVIDAALANVKVRGDQKEIYIKTAAGNIDVNSRTAEMDINTISGKVQVRMLKSRELKIRSISSDIRLQMAELEGKVKASSMSGEICIDKGISDDVKKYGKSIEEKWSEEHRSIHMSSVSGNISVEKL